MAQIPNLQSTNTLGTDDQAILRQGTIDKRISLNLAGILSWATREGYSHIGEHTTGSQFPDADSFTTFQGQVFFPADGVTTPYTAIGNDPTADTNLNVKTQRDSINSNTLGGLTNYQATSVANAIDGNGQAESKMLTVGGDLINLEVNQIVVVDDYYGGVTPSNSGVLFFKVVVAGTGTADGGKYIDVPGGEFQLEQNVKRPYSPKAWGAMPNRQGDSTVSINSCSSYLESIGGGDLVIDGDFRITDTVNSYKGINFYGTNPSGKQGGSNLHWDPSGLESEYRLKPVVRYKQPNAEFLDAIPKFSNFGITSPSKAVAGILIDGSVAPVAWWNIHGVVINPDDGTPFNTPSDQFLFGIWSAKGFSYQIGTSTYIKNCVVGVHQMGNDCTSSSLKDSFITTCRYDAVLEGIAGFESSGMSYENPSKKRIVIGNNELYFSNSAVFEANYCFGSVEEHSVFVDKDIRPIYNQIDTDYANWYTDALASIGFSIPSTVSQTDPTGIKFGNNLLAGEVHVPDDRSCVQLIGNTYALTADRSFKDPTLQELLSETVGGGASRVSAYKYRNEDSAYSREDINYISQRQVGEFAIAFDYPDDVALGEFSVVDVDTRFAILTANIESLNDSFNALSGHIEATARLAYVGSNALASLVSNVAGSYLYIREKGQTSVLVNIGDTNVTVSPNTTYELVARTTGKAMSGQVVAIRPTNGITCETVV
ncbi:hypothetical protein VPBG_00062 [Vibrio phage helene 12B3]|uniref:hypothetical protein n=1 Tax=Vibrio phage helene 12B3 TaxID=573173 RepID=UPI0002C04A6E|nr:hypothetical protein VPBG_00062 [Vibrio phage helene 12B3]AGG57834.1 hypothetical protein VPBG_00062 [Vibrio phage helene 12B3]